MTTNGIPASLDALRAALAEPGASLSRPSIKTPRRAAVLALFVGDAGAGGPQPHELSLVLVEKSAHLRHHAGQVALPGGRIEGDETPTQAALREAWEETGLEAASITVLGELPPIGVVASGNNVTTVVGWTPQVPALVPRDADEIAAVHIVPVVALADPAQRVMSLHPNGRRGPTFLVGDLFVWGFTGYVLDHLLSLAGWDLPWDADRAQAIPERFLGARHDDGR